MNEQQYYLVRVIQKIRIFEGFDLRHIQQLLRIARIQKYAPGKMIYRMGEPSDEMMVLLKGHLAVTNNAGDVLAEIKAGAPIGEMGVFTGQTRSANIAALELATGLVIDKEGLMGTFSANADMLIMVQKNLITVLSERLNEANDASNMHLRKIQELEKRVGMSLGGDDDDDDMYEEEDE
jgi:putative ABC transport system ATP-binding protein